MTNSSQVFHDKAIESGKELRKIIVSLSTGILAIFFLALTREIKPLLQPLEKIILILSISLFSVSIFSGIIAWFIDSNRYYFMAKAKEASEKKEDQEKTKYKKKFKVFEILRVFTDIFLFIPFFSGIVVSAIFLVLRIDF